MDLLLVEFTCGKLLAPTCPELRLQPIQRCVLVHGDCCAVGVRKQQ